MEQNALSDAGVLFDMMKRLDDKLDNVSTKLEEKNDINYRRMEEKMDSNYDILDKKMTEFNENISKNLDSVKDKLQDHEYRIRNIESTSKNTNDQILKQLTDIVSVNQIQKKTEEAEWHKRIFTPFNVIISLILVLVFISGRYDLISSLFKIIFPSLR